MIFIDQKQREWRENKYRLGCDCYSELPRNCTRIQTFSKSTAPCQCECHVIDDSPVIADKPKESWWQKLKGYLSNA